MATNVVKVSIYQINSRPPIPLAQATEIAFPTQGMIIGDCTGSPTRSLSTGVNVYAFLQDSKGNKYYTSSTVAALVAAFNA